MLKAFFILFTIFSISLATDHGIYLKVVENIPDDFSATVSKVETSFGTAESPFNLLSSHPVATPKLVGSDCDFKAHLFVVENPDYTKFLTSFGDKYLVAAFLKIGLYQNKNGTQVVVTDPETINRIVFNDLKDSEYQRVISGTKKFKNELISLLHGLKLANNVEQPMEPIRSDKSLRKAAKDMFMMVGPMTFFKDEDQFPVIFEQKTSNAKTDLKKLLEQMEKNLAIFEPSTKDVEYQKVNDAKAMKWQIISKITAPDSNAVLLGITRPRTEALSFKIAGQSRANEDNPCPGIDHLCAYPVEVLVLKEGDKIVVRTAREMFRMDMYFWDAGKMAFMKYMNMPGLLDKSIKRALFAK